MSMFNDISWGSEDNERECTANVTLLTLFAKRFPPGRWSFFGPRSKKKWYPFYIDRPRGERDSVPELMMIKFRESGHPVFRVTRPLSRGTFKSKGDGKLSTHFCADGATTIISVSQLGIYGAVSDLCDECKSCHVRTRRAALAGQSDPLFESARLFFTTTTPLTEVSRTRKFIAKVQRTSGKALTTIPVDQNLY